ncbi:MAG: DUF4384 domain-containing protein [Myxococcaceae bacterium]|nr:DUF4384 domain-containing protein [Myxococcaceae bacterium]
MNARGHLSAETIDLLHLAALKPDQAAVAQKHLEGCAACRGRWDELVSDSQKFAQYVYPRTVGEVTSRLVNTSLIDRLRLWGFGRMLVPAVGVAAAAAIAGVVVLGNRAPVNPAVDDGYVGIKGAPTFKVVAQRVSGGQLEVKNDTVLHPGDRVRFVAQPAGARFLLVVGKDSRGSLNVYHPLDGQKSAEVKAGELPGSFELDDSVGTEQLWAVYSAEALEAQAVKSALGAGQSVPGAQVVALSYRKEAKGP